MPKSKKCGKWNKFEDQKLLKLFEAGAIDIRDLNSGNIHKIIRKYFSDHPYYSFSSLFKR